MMIQRSIGAYLLRRLKWSFGDRSPLVAYLKITRRCNLDCYYCPWHTTVADMSGEIGTAEWLAIIDQLAARGVRIFVFEGGEPTLRRDLPRLLAAVRSKKAISIVATNAIAQPWHLSASAFTVSVDGPAELHDKVRGAGSFRRLVSTLEQRDERAVVAIHVITELNHRHLVETVHSVKSLVDGFLFTFEYPYRTVLTSTLSASAVERAKDTIATLSGAVTVLNPLSRLRSATGTRACHDWLAVSVDHAGVVKDGCFVQQIEPKRCDVCELGCFQVISAFLEFELAAWVNFSALLLGAPRSRLSRNRLTTLTG
jgi:organic radical activating enzyme